MSDVQIKKSHFKKKKNFSFKAIEKLREDINKIDPNKIIIEALNSANNKSSDKSIKKNELLEQTQKNAVSTFLSDIRNKDKNPELVKSAYIKQLKDFTNSTNLLVERARKETREYISKFEVLNNENKMNVQRIKDIRNQYKELNSLQENSINQINQMKMRDNVLIENKALFNEFLKQFNNQSPKKIMQDIEKQNEGFRNISKEYSNIINKIAFEKQLFNMQYQKGYSEVSNTNNKIHNLEEENALLQKEFEYTVNELQSEIRNLQGLKEDNDKYRKMLYQLYNRLIGAYCLDKNIRINKKYLHLNKEDYKPNLLDDNEICKYIKLMISSMNPSTSDQLLRETIAYSNMITRVYLKNKINLKYDPLSTFKELKDIMEKKEEKIAELSNNVKMYEAKINKMAVENRKLNKLINHFHQEKNKNIQIKQNINNSSNNLKPSSSYKLLNGSNTRNINNRYKKSNINFKLRDEPKKSRLNSATPNVNIRLKQKRQINAKNDESKTKTSTSFKKTKFNQSTNNAKTLYDEDSKYRYSSIDSKRLKNPLFQSLQSMYNNQLLNKYYKINNASPTKSSKYINLKHYNKQNIMTFINEFQQLIDHTNRLFLYQAKISPKIFGEKNNKSLSSNRRMNDINILIKKNHSNGNLLQDFVKTKIVRRINGIINNLEEKETKEGEDNMEIK